MSGDEDWEGYDLEIYLYEDRFGVDANVYLGTLENIVPFQVYTVSESVPAEWRTCDPAELYFYGYYDLTSSFESCRFVPENILEDAGCGAVTSPAEGDVVELAMNTITWTLDDEVWDGWNVELYLYQELSLWPDPYWYLGDALATSHELSVDLGALGVSTSADSTWYVAVYWRFGYVFTSQALPESGRFTLDDVLESICDLSVTWDSGVNLDCCASDGSLRNDLCRLSLADVSLDVVDFALDVPYNATMPCLLTAGVNVTGEVTLVYQDSDEVVTYHTAVSVSESLDFDLRTLDYSKTFQVVDLADLAFPGPAVSGLVNAILAMECTADGISAVASIQGSALIAGYQVAEQTQEVYRYEAISWPDLDAEPTSAPTAPGPTAEPTAAPTAAPTASDTEEEEDDGGVEEATTWSVLVTLTFAELMLADWTDDLTSELLEGISQDLVVALDRVELLSLVEGSVIAQIQINGFTDQIEAASVNISDFSFSLDFGAVQADVGAPIETLLASSQQQGDHYYPEDGSNNIGWIIGGTVVGLLIVGYCYYVNAKPPEKEKEFGGDSIKRNKQKYTVDSDSDPDSDTDVKPGEVAIAMPPQPDSDMSSSDEDEMVELVEVEAAPPPPGADDDTSSDEEDVTPVAPAPQPGTDSDSSSDEEDKAQVAASPQPVEESDSSESEIEEIKSVAKPKIQLVSARKSWIAKKPDQQLSFEEDDIIRVIKVTGKWDLGCLFLSDTYPIDNKARYFPSNYVTELDEEDTEEACMAHKEREEYYRRMRDESDSSDSDSD